MSSPKTRYEARLRSGTLRENPAQAALVNVLEERYHALTKRHRERQTLLGRLRHAICPPPPIQGLYLYGPVGIGKTTFIDLFYESLPLTKRRQHFFAFMQNIYQQLNKHEGRKDPLHAIAKKIASRYDVLCFDEFFVKQIADAMLLGRLLEALFKQGVCLIATSNRPPDELYKEGLQRERFLPAIALIKKHTQVMTLTSPSDYRQHFVATATIYHTPNDLNAQHALEKAFERLSQGKTLLNKKVIIQERAIPVEKHSKSVAWFHFDTLCKGARSPEDYLAIAERYPTIILSNIPKISAADRNTVTRFINLIDILYDNHTRIIASAADAPDKLYPKGPLHFEFQRTASRLVEMQSMDYFEHP